MECKPVEPAFVVFESLDHLAPLEVLLVRGIAVGFEAGHNHLLLLCRKEVGSSWVVCDEPVGKNRHDDCKKTLL